MIKNDDLPKNVETESELIGLMIKFALIRNDALAILKRNDFFLPEHQIIFDIIYDLNNKNKNVNIYTIWDNIKVQKKDNLVHFNFLTYLLESVVTDKEYFRLIDIIKENSNLRSLLVAISKIESDFLSNRNELDDYSSFVASAQKTINLIADQRKISNFMSSHEIVEDVERYIFDIANKRKENDLIGIDTGFKELNYYTNGFQKQNLIIVAGRPGLGKTAFALNLVLNIAREGKNAVAMFEMEMSTRMLYLRLVSNLSKVKYNKVAKGRFNDTEKVRISESLKVLEKLKIYVDESSSLSIMDLIAKSRKLKAQCPDLVMIVIDYLGLISSDIKNNVRKYNTRQLEIQEYSRLLHELARELDVTIVLLCQLNRKVEERGGVPRLSDLRESGSIEQDAELVLLLHREDYGKNELVKEKNKDNLEDNSYPIKNSEDDQTSILDIIIAKNRNGESDRRFQLFFRKSYGNMIDVPYDFENQKKKIEQELEEL
ncbi:MAG: replicative DNA helicase [Bacilli bacterium]|nr:replicative DNA helicase [Bacilli bacterium]